MRIDESQKGKRRGSLTQNIVMAAFSIFLFFCFLVWGLILRKRKTEKKRLFHSALVIVTDLKTNSVSVKINIGGVEMEMEEEHEEGNSNERD